MASKTPKSPRASTPRTTGTSAGVRRPEWVVAAAVLVSTPMIPGILDGDIGASGALLRFLGALLGCWIAGRVLITVVDRYAEAARRAEITAMVESTTPYREPAPQPPGPGPGGSPTELAVPTVPVALNPIFADGPVHPQPDQGGSRPQSNG